MNRTSLALLAAPLLGAVGCQSPDGAQLRSLGLQAQAYPTGVITAAEAAFSR